MSYIIENLYMGSECDAYDGKYLKMKFGVNHLLTIDSKPLTLEAKEGFTYKHVYALDDIDTDLLTKLEECNQFIDEGRQSGGILVHCQAGMSRSGTVVVAYIMKNLDLSVDEALKLVRSQKPDTWPNSGFLQQLRLFECMGNSVDAKSATYKAYKLEKLSQQFKNGSVVLSDTLMGDDPSVYGSDGEAVYKCRKCRRSLFKKSCIMCHNRGCGKETFQQPWLVHEKVEQVPCTQSLFIQPVLWMKSQILAIEGKLTCPKCTAKLGSYKWCGERCPCGQWIIPAFHVDSGKVDECKPRLNHPIVSISKPVEKVP